jgi:DNA ligase-1
MMPTLLAADRTAPPTIVLAEVYRQGIDVSQYLVSEKYDGVRGIWNGHTLHHRSGNVINAPAWFIASLPPTPLDGELWLARGKFSELAKIIRRAEPIDDEWRQVRYMIFELPDAPGSFSERAQRLKSLVSELKLPWLFAVDQFRVADTAALMKLFKHYVKGGAEGLMLHRADAPYVTGRSDVLLKLKPSPDAEARVIAYVPGKGRFFGRVGALEVETSDGKRFRIGSGLSDAERTNPPSIGSLVTYRYQELTAKGIPRFPRFWRVRDEF